MTWVRLPTGLRNNLIIILVPCRARYLMLFLWSLKRSMLPPLAAKAIMKEPSFCFPLFPLFPHFSYNTFVLSLLFYVLLYPPLPAFFFFCIVLCLLFSFVIYIVYISPFSCYSIVSPASFSSVSWLTKSRALSLKCGDPEVQASDVNS